MAEIKFKDLTVDDLFNFCLVLDAIGAEQVFDIFGKKEITAIQNKKEDSKSIGIAVTMKIAGVVIRSIPKARKEMCSFVAGCTEWDNGTNVTAEDVEKIKIGSFAKLIHDFFKKEDLTDFFSQVAGYMGMGQSDSKNLSQGDTEKDT